MSELTEAARLRAALEKIAEMNKWTDGERAIDLAREALGQEVSQSHLYRADCLCDDCETKRYARRDGETRREYKLRMQAVGRVVDR